MNKWRKFWTLSPEEKVLLAKALVLLPAARLGLRTLGLRRMQTVFALGRRNPARHASSGQTPTGRARRSARLVAAAAHFTGGTCLERSLVLACILERQGIPADLRIGVRSGDRGFEAHSWIEAGGEVLNEGRDVGQRYAAFDRNFATARMNGR